MNPRIGIAAIVFGGLIVAVCSFLAFAVVLSESTRPLEALTTSALMGLIVMATVVTWLGGCVLEIRNEAAHEAYVSEVTS